MLHPHQPIGENTQRLEIFKGKFKDTNVEPCKISQWWPDQWMGDQQYHK
jgi:hypothetical protein